MKKNILNINENDLYLNMKNSLYKKNKILNFNEELLLFLKKTP